MPYVVGDGDPIQDVFRSNNVFVNNVPVALWLAPGTSGLFAGDVLDAPVTIAPATNQANQTKFDAYAANPSSYSNPTAAANGVKQNFPGTPESTEDAPSLPPNTNAAASDVKTCLDKIFDEAKRGMWRETGQNGRPSNPNIVGIWRSLGYPTSNYWSTDQTPWCMGFINFALKQSGYRYVQEASSWAIRNKPSRWNATPVPPAQAQPGDIVLWNFGHVNFVYTNNGGKLSFIGGNQTPTSGSNNNPNDGDVTISWPSGWTLNRGGIEGIWRPSKT